MNNTKCQNDLIKYMAVHYNLPINESRKAVLFLFRLITRHLAKNIWVRVVGFGEFKKRIRQQKKGINPQTKQAMNIPKRHVIHCAFSTGFMKD